MNSGGMGVWGGLALLALACGAAHAGDYGGAGGPLYGDGAPAHYGAALDYRAPDASAPLDYKYVEESQGNTERSTEDTVELDTWEKAPRIRGQRRERFSEMETMPRSKSRYKRVRSRTRAARRRPRARDDEPADKEYLHIDKLNHQADMNKQLDEDFYTFNLAKTTDRIIRRKPRDRLFNNHVKPLKRDDLESEEELFMDRKLKSESMEREDAADLEEEGVGAAPRARPTADDDEEMEPRARYRDDADYYDMRRLHDINSKLPLLLHRTTTRPAPARAAPSSAGAEDLLALLWSARRASLKPDVFAPAPDHSSRNSDTTSDADPRPSNEHSGSSIALNIATFPTLTSPPTASTPGSASELSMAERSRLSILKKSQKKDNDKGEVSKKPPVLLQVTSKLPTLVMVEPPTSADPWMRARHVSGDSPQKLARVKRLMRRKLVAGAGSIQDLTDNWDDMVCDYIDVSLLGASPPRRRDPALPFICTTLALLL